MATLDLIDNRLDIESPLGVGVSLPIAGLPARGAGFILDLFIRALIIGAVASVASLLGFLGDGLMYLLFFVMDNGYLIICNALFNGRTLGKMVVGTQVVHANGTPLTLSGNVLRTLLMNVDFLPAMWLLGAACIATSKDFTRFGDKIASTVVVYYGKSANKKVNPTRVNTVVRLEHELLPDERKAVLSFQDRYELLDNERAKEIADALEALVKQENAATPDLVLGVAEGIRRSS